MTTNTTSRGRAGSLRSRASASPGATSAASTRSTANRRRRVTTVLPLLQNGRHSPLAFAIGPRPTPCSTEQPGILPVPRRHRGSEGGIRKDLARKREISESAKSAKARNDAKDEKPGRNNHRRVHLPFSPFR